MDLQMFPIIKLLALNSFTIFASYLIVRFALKRNETIDFMLSTLIVFLCQIVVITLVLGIVGHLTFTYLLLFCVGFFLAITMVFINKVMKADGAFDPFKENKEQVSIGWVLSLLVLTFCVGGLVSGLISPPNEHDVMTYHLFFPARWIQEGRLFVVPTFFGDIAPAYAPSNAELTFAFWSIPFNNDALSRVGQFPFLIVAILAVFLLAKNYGETSTAAVIPVTLCVLSPVVFRQGFSAEVDLAMGAAFVAAVYFLDCFRKEPSIPNSALFGLSLGLAIGIKFVAAIFCILLIVPFLYFLVRNFAKNKKATVIYLAVAGGFALLVCGYWFARNWALTGNPLFPLDMPPLFDGAYNKSAMEKSPFHIPSLQFVLPVWVAAYGLWLMVVAMAGWMGLLFLVVKKRVGGFYLYIALLPLLIAFLHFGLVPYDTQYRFLIPAVLLSFLPYAQYDTIDKIRWPVRIFWAVLLGITVIGPGFSFKLGIFPVTGSGTLPKAYVSLFIGLLLIGFGALILMRKFRIKVLARFVFVLIVLTVIGLFIMPVITGGRAKQIVAVRSNLPSEYPVHSWVWINRIREPSVIAYSGNNVPYHLLGADWRHKVMYVNTWGDVNDGFHDFWMRCRKNNDCPLPGESDKPSRIWRQEDREQWLFNLVEAKAEYLFITAMHYFEREYINHDHKRFPVENQWANSLPDVFSLVFSSDKARIYQINKISLASIQ